MAQDKSPKAMQARHDEFVQYADLGHWLVALFLLALTATLAACSMMTPTPSPSPAPASVTIVQQPTLTTTSAAMPTATSTPTPMPGSTMPPKQLGINFRKPDETAVWFNTDALTVYTRDGRLCSLLAGRKPYFIADATWAGNAQVSSDGELVAFEKSPIIWTDRGWYEAAAELWVAHPDGSRLRQVFSSEQVMMTPALARAQEFPDFLYWGWIPGTHQIALTAGGNDSPDGITRNNDLYRIDADTWQVVTLLKPGDGGGYFSVSPDGRHIAVVRESVPPQTDTISLIDSNGSHWQPDVLSYPVVFTYTEHWAPASLDWSPDSRGVWVAIPPHDPANAGDRGMVLWYLPATGGEAKVIARFDTVEDDYETPVVSPDGVYLAYQGKVDGQAGLHILRVATGQDILTLPLDSQTRFEYWLPDSKHFRFQKQGETFLVGLDGQPPHPDISPTPTLLPNCEPDQPPQ